MENSKNLKGQNSSYKNQNDGSAGAPALKNTRKTGEVKSGSEFLQNKLKSAQSGN